MSTKRIDKLVHVKQMAVDAAEGALASARVQTATAELALVAIERAWAEAVERAALATCTADLADADAHGRTLRQAVQRAEWTVLTKRREEQRHRALVSEARTELRRFEMWSERAAATASAQATRVQRRAEDDLAARHGRNQ